MSPHLEGLRRAAPRTRAACLVVSPLHAVSNRTSRSRSFSRQGPESRCSWPSSENGVLRRWRSDARRAWSDGDPPAGGSGARGERTPTATATRPLEPRPDAAQQPQTRHSAHPRQSHDRSAAAHTPDLRRVRGIQRLQDAPDARRPHPSQHHVQQVAQRLQPARISLDRSYAGASRSCSGQEAAAARLN